MPAFSWRTMQFDFIGGSGPADLIGGNSIRFGLVVANNSAGVLYIGTESNGDHLHPQFIVPASGILTLLYKDLGSIVCSHFYILDSFATQSGCVTELFSLPGT